MTFRRWYILERHEMIFISLGDPYKLFDYPYLKEYINAYSNTAESQKAALKVISGETPTTGKNPFRSKAFLSGNITFKSKTRR